MGTFTVTGRKSGGRGSLQEEKGGLEPQCNPYRHLYECALTESDRPWLRSCANEFLKVFFFFWSGLLPFQLVLTTTTRVLHGMAFLRLSEITVWGRFWAANTKLCQLKSKKKKKQQQKNSISHNKLSNLLRTYSPRTCVHFSAHLVKQGEPPKVATRRRRRRRRSRWRTSF